MIETKNEMRSARNQALEEAARICEGVSSEFNPMTAGDCADAIRALKETIDVNTLVYKLVPVEATPEMLVGAVGDNVLDAEWWRFWYATAYRALVAAAPSNETVKP